MGRRRTRRKPKPRINGGYYASRGYVAVSIQYRIQKDNPPATPGPAPGSGKNEQFRLMNAACQDTCNAVRWVRTNADKYDIDQNRIGIGGVSAGAFNALNTAFCDEKLTGPDAEVAAVISLMAAVGANHSDKDDPPVFIAHGSTGQGHPARGGLRSGDSEMLFNLRGDMSEQKNLIGEHPEIAARLKKQVNEFEARFKNSTRSAGTAG